MVIFSPSCPNIKNIKIYIEKETVNLLSVQNLHWSVCCLAHFLLQIQGSQHRAATSPCWRR